MIRYHSGKNFGFDGTERRKDRHCTTTCIEHFQFLKKIFYNSLILPSHSTILMDFTPRRTVMACTLKMWIQKSYCTRPNLEGCCYKPSDQRGLLQLEIKHRAPNSSTDRRWLRALSPTSFFPLPPLCQAQR